MALVLISCAYTDFIPQLLSGQIPYGKVAATPSIWYILLQGKRPARPHTLSAERWITDTMWTFINEMTHPQPECRPSMAEVVTRLERFSLELDPDHLFAAAQQEDEEFEYEKNLDTRDENVLLPAHQPLSEKPEHLAPSKGILKRAPQVSTN